MWLHEDVHSRVAGDGGHTGVFAERRSGEGAVRRGYSGRTSGKTRSSETDLTDAGSNLPGTSSHHQGESGNRGNLPLQGSSVANPGGATYGSLRRLPYADQSLPR